MAALAIGTTQVTAQQLKRNGNTVSYNDNNFRMTAAGARSDKGDRQMQVPDEMNGKKIYTASEVTTATLCKAAGGSLEKYVIDGLGSALQASKWPDGTYRIDVRSVVIDANGKVVFYTYEGTSKKEGATWRSVSDGPIATTIEKLMKNAPMHPAMYQGQTVIAYNDLHLDNYDILVKNHTLMSYTKRN